MKKNNVIPRETKQYKIVLDAEYATTVLPDTMRFFHKKTYSDFFQLALGLLAFMADVLKKNHRLVEVDEEGNPIQYLVFPEFESWRYSTHHKVHEKPKGAQLDEEHLDPEKDHRYERQQTIPEPAPGR